MNLRSLICSLIVGISAANAQTSPDPADQLRREQERQQQLEENQRSIPGRGVLKTLGDRDAKVIPHEAHCFPIDRVVFVPFSADVKNTRHFDWALDAANSTLLGVPDRAMGRCLGIEGIQLVVRRVQNAIIEEGYTTTRVFLGPQNLKTKELKLALVPGHLRDVRFKDPKVRVTSSNTIPRRKDDLLFLRNVEQGLENLKRVPTAEADFEIVPSSAPGAGPGDSDVVIDWRQKKPLRFSVSFDDSGSEATGKYKGNVTLSWDNPLGLSDLFYVSLNSDLGGGLSGPRGTKAKSLHYSLPFGYWLAALDVSQSDYHQTVAGATQDYVYSGESDNASLKFSRILHRDKVSKTNWYVSGWARSSKNFIDDTEVAVQRRRTAGWELGLSHTRYIKRATLDLDLALRRGTGAFNALNAPEEAFGEGDSRPTIVKLDASLNSPINLFGQEWTYSGRLKGQWSGTPLVAQDRFSIGSRYTVRGFTGERTLSGERGWTLRNDFSRKIGQSSHSAYFGVDLGAVRGPSTKDLAGKSMAGIALGVKGEIEGVNYNAFIAKAIHRPSSFANDGVVFDFTLNWTF